MKLLMHICCANCCLFPIRSLFSKGIDIKVLWFNPNIHPYREYQMRLDSVQQLQKSWDLSVEYIDDYGLKDFVRAVVNREDDRCGHCYSVRLEQTAITAKKMGLDGFTTSLLVSPYQKFDMIINTGEIMGKRHGITFHAEDYRPGWHEGTNLSRELGLYRQKYCGCIYSEMERYQNRKTGGRRRT
jgi:epoxyqueuosine reductase